MSRRLSASINEGITYSPGALATFHGPGTIIHMWRPLAVLAEGLFTALNTGSNTLNVNPFSDGFIYYGITGHGFVNSTPATYTATDGWRIDVFRKGVGNVNVRYSHYLFNAPGWVHTDQGNMADTTTDADSLFLGKLNSSQTLNGRLGAVAIWNGTVLTDAQIDSSNMETSLQSWMNKNPSAAWKFNIDDVASGSLDITGNGANETSHSGTIFDADEPAGFSYALSTLSGSMFIPFFG